MTKVDGALADDAQGVYLWRVGEGWTQEQAAKWAGVSVRSWRRYESGDGRRPRWLLTKIARRQAALARHGTRH